MTRGISVVAANAAARAQNCWEVNRQSAPKGASCDFRWRLSGSTVLAGWLGVGLVMAVAHPAAAQNVNLTLDGTTETFTVNAGGAGTAWNQTFLFTNVNPAQIRVEAGSPANSRYDITDLGTPVASTNIPPPSPSQAIINAQPGSHEITGTSVGITNAGDNGTIVANSLWIDNTRSSFDQTTPAGSASTLTFAGGTLKPIGMYAEWGQSVAILVRGSDYSGTLLPPGTAGATVDASGPVVVFRGVISTIDNGSFVKTGANELQMQGGGTLADVDNQSGRLVFGYGAGANFTADSITNSGELVVAGGYTLTAAAFTNNAGASLATGATSQMSVDIDNAGTVKNSGAYTGDVFTNTGSITSTGGSASWAGTVDSNGATGTITNEAGSEWDGSITANDGVITNTGTDTTWTGDVVGNGGTIENAAGAVWNGKVLANAEGAAITNTGTGTTWVGDINNDGTVHNYAGAVWTGTLNSNTSKNTFDNNNSTYNGDVTSNTGTILNHNTAEWNGDVLSNGGTISNLSGASWNGDLQSNLSGAAVSNDGVGTIWIGAVLGNSGSIVNQNGAIWRGDATNTALGTLGTSATWDGSIFNSGHVEAAGTITRNLSNLASGEVFVSGDLSVGQSLTNVGLVHAGSSTAALRVEQNLANAGTVNMTSSGGGLYNRISVGGTFRGEPGSVVAMDIDLSSGGTGLRSDRIDATNIEGTTALQFNSVGTRGLFSERIVVASGEGSADAFAAASGLESQGLVDYRLVYLNNGAGSDQWAVQSSLNPSGGSLSQTVAATLTTLTTSFLESVSAFVSEPADPSRDQISYGVWGRMKGGSYSIDSTVTTHVAGSGISESAPGTFNTTFSGFQVGVDLSRSDISGSGWSTHVGLTAGDVWLDTTMEDAYGISSKVDAPFYGVYAAVLGHGMFADFQVQRNQYNIDMTNAAASLNGHASSASGWTMVANAGGAISLVDAWFVEPSAGLNYATASVDDVLLPGDLGALHTNTYESLIGNLRLRLGTTIVANSTLVLRPSVEGSVWHEFSGEGTGAYVDVSGDTATFGTSSLGTFGQIGLALTGQTLDAGVVGNIRVDYRFGENIEGASLSGSLRRQF